MTAPVKPIQTQPADLSSVTAAYLAAFPTEETRLQRFQLFLRDTPPGPRYFDRNNFSGHITASGFVLSPNGAKLAVVNHTFLGRFLQPGGHVDATDADLIAAARREVEEETGLIDLRLLPFLPDSLVPLDIDSHQIPANPKKNEPSHWHHDFRYLFQAAEECDPLLFKQEGEGAWAWRLLDCAMEEESFPLVLAKIKQRLAFNFREA